MGVGESISPMVESSEGEAGEEARSESREAKFSKSTELNGVEEEEGEECGVCGGKEVERLVGREDKRRPRGIGDPRKPTEKEVEEHELTHLPYRNWCSVCVRAKGRDLDHRKAVGEGREVSEYGFDYCFPGDELGFKLTVLSGRERLTGMNFGIAVPTKGSSGRFAVDKALEFVEEVGDGRERIIVKSDQEPSMKYFVNDFVEAREEGRTILEESPVGSSGSNGVVERGVQGLEGQLRVLVLGLEARLGVPVDPKWPIVTFMPEYAAYLMNRLEVGKDGKTAYERVKGKKATVLGIEFGEKLLYKVKPKEKMAKIEARWEPGIFVGVRRRSGEVWIAVKGKVFGARSVRRLPVDERWGKDCVEWVDRVPWNRYKDVGDADGEVPEGVSVGEKSEREGEGQGPRVVFVGRKEKAPREFYIRKEDAEKHGYTRGCGGCSSWHRGLGRQPHNEKCRERFRELMREEARVKNAEARRREFVDKQEAKRRKKDAKKEEKRRRDGEEDAVAEDSKKRREGEDRDPAGDGRDEARGLKRGLEGESEGNKEIQVGSVARGALEALERWCVRSRGRLKRSWRKQKKEAQRRKG